MQPADGYTILAQANAFTLLPYMKIDPGYDPIKDFEGIGFMTRSPNLLVTSAEQPDRTVSDVIARSKKSR
jgi:tripartite-type tricarboxylate transporter receptor subunit TctC